MSDISGWEPVVTLSVDGHPVRTTPGHPFFTAGGWVNAGLKVGDRVRTSDGTWATGQAVAVEGPQPVHGLVPGFAPYLSSGLLPASTLIPTAAGLKPIKDIRVGDFVVVPSPERN